MADHKTRRTCRWVCCRGRKPKASIDATVLVLDVRKVFWWDCEVANEGSECSAAANAFMILAVSVASTYDMSDCLTMSHVKHTAIATLNKFKVSDSFLVETMYLPTSLTRY